MGKLTHSSLFCWGIAPINNRYRPMPGPRYPACQGRHHPRLRWNRTGWVAACALMTDRVLFVPLVELPPGPEFHADEADEAAGDEVKEPLPATVNLGVAGHFRFEQPGSVVQFCRHQHGPLRLPVGLHVGDGGDGVHLALEGPAWIG